MTPASPPAWMECLLRVFLSPRDRETVLGDLYEEFHESRVPLSGPARASLWYLRQTVSFAPRRLYSLLVSPGALALLCIFTATCGAWLGWMDFLLRHAGFAGQMMIAVTICLQALLTLAALRIRQNTYLRFIAMLGCFPLLFLAAKALLGLLRGADMEGYILVIAMALVMQALLTLGTLRTGCSSPYPATL